MECGVQENARKCKKMQQYATICKKKAPAAEGLTGLWESVRLLFVGDVQNFVHLDHGAEHVEV